MVRYLLIIFLVLMLVGCSTEDFTDKFRWKADVGYYHMYTNEPPTLRNGQVCGKNGVLEFKSKGSSFKEFKGTCLDLSQGTYRLTDRGGR